MIPPPLMACHLLPLHSEIHAKAARGDLSTNMSGKRNVDKFQTPSHPVLSIQFTCRPVSMRHLAAELAPRGASTAAK
jgi:hypothetical protein